MSMTIPMTMRSYFWLQPAAPAAIAVFRVVLDADCDADYAAQTSIFSKALPSIGAARFVLLLDAAGQPIDEVVLLRISEEMCDVHCHGGVGIRAAVDAAMQQQGYILTSVQIDQHWQDLSQIAHPAALPLIKDWVQLDPNVRSLCMRQPIILITGPANAGKSTLLNAWCGHQRALVSDRAGTTRDLIAALTTVHGWVFRVIDSAGLRESDDEIEHAGQALVERARGWADVVVSLQPYGSDDSYVQAGDIVVHSQWDRSPDPVATGKLSWSAEPWNSAVSAQQDIQALAEQICDRLQLPYL